jgi:hypothetical protein
MKLEQHLTPLQVVLIGVLDLNQTNRTIPRVAHESAVACFENLGSLPVSLFLVVAGEGYCWRMAYTSPFL